MLEAYSVNDPSLVYMYGLSDFWVDMFSDGQLIETLLDGETILLGEAYSYFLQRAAGISLTDIQEKYDTRIKLLLLNESDLVDSSDLSEFNIDTSYEEISKLSNRPLLPTQTLSDGVHFDVTDGVLKLYKPIDELKFPIRYNTDGTWQYAVWMCDVEVNDNWLDSSFGSLVGFTEEDAIFNYKSFLEGVYYLYANGPSIANIVRGVNLAMGMPYARATETVLDISQDEVSGNWVVFTANYAYEIPYSYQPSILAGDTLTESEVLSTWVEVRDYSTSGAWWYQIYLPSAVLGPDTDSYELGLATEGSTADVMMTNFLKNHMFEVLITQPTSDTTAYDTVRSLVLRSKPAYTYPVFVWKADISDEEINLDGTLSYNYNSDISDYCMAPPSVRFMVRSNEDTEFTRGTSWYNRVQGSEYMVTLLGYGDWEGNAGWAPQFDSISDATSQYLGSVLHNRGDMISAVNRGTICRGWRGVSSFEDSGLEWDIPADKVYGGDDGFLVNERDITPLYLMNESELLDKMLTVDSRFTVGDKTRFIVTGLNLTEVYSTWMIRNSSIAENEDESFLFEYSEANLDNAFSVYAYQTHVPSKLEMYDSDGDAITDGTLLITKSTSTSWVCQWVRTRFATSPTLFPAEDANSTISVEEFRADAVGETPTVGSVFFNQDVTRAQTPIVVDGVQDVIIVSDGLYVSINDYSIDFENSEAELPAYVEDDPLTLELDILNRTYAVLDTAPDVNGYLIYDEASTYTTVEETLTPVSAGVYTLSESPDREHILVIVDGVFRFDYTVSGNTLTIADTTEVTVRYVNHTSEETLAAGSDTYTLSSDSHCKIFVGSSLLGDWSFTRSGTTITLPEVTTEDVTVRYGSAAVDDNVAMFSRSSVEGSKARFLMDRNREDGEYEDGMGNTIYMTRGGIPSDSTGTDVDVVNVIRRLI